MRWKIIGTAWALHLAACSGGARSDDLVALRFADRVDPMTYLAEYEQDVQWGVGQVERRYAARYTLGVDDGAHGSARLDTLRIEVATPHGRQVLDTRHLHGSTFQIAIAATGGRPTYGENTPLFEMPGMLEGEVALHRLLDFGFPHLPEAPVRVGDRWSGRTTAPHVEANVIATADATIDYTFDGWERVDGVDCARIVGRITADVHAPEHEIHGAPVQFNGSLEGELTWLFDPATGGLLRMSGETSSDGLLTAAGNDTNIKQITRVRIEPVRAG